MHNAQSGHSSWLCWGALLLSHSAISVTHPAAHACKQRDARHCHAYFVVYIQRLNCLSLSCRMRYARYCKILQASKDLWGGRNAECQPANVLDGGTLHRCGLSEAGVGVIEMIFDEVARTSQPIRPHLATHLGYEGK